MSAPLADRLRPQTLDDVVGQRHLLAEGRRCAVLLIPAKYLTWCLRSFRCGKNDTCYHDCQNY